MFIGTQRINLLSNLCSDKLLKFTSLESNMHWFSFNFFLFMGRIWCLILVRISFLEVIMGIMLAYQNVMTGLCLVILMTGVNCLGSTTEALLNGYLRSTNLQFTNFIHLINSMFCKKIDGNLYFCVFRLWFSWSIRGILVAKSTVMRFWQL